MDPPIFTMKSVNNEKTEPGTSQEANKNSTHVDQLHAIGSWKDPKTGFR